MKKLLRISIYGYAIALFSVTAGNAQVKTAPQLQAKIQPVTAAKAGSKLSAALTALHDKAIGNPLGRAKPVGLPNGLDKIMQVKGDKVLVDFTAKTNINTAKAELQKLGVTITAVYGRVLSGYVPINVLPQLEAVSSVRFVKPSFKPRHQSVKGGDLAGSAKSYSTFGAPKPTPVTSQGDTAMYAYLARKKYHSNGDGVKVGILSDSYNNLGTADEGVKAGELPGKKNPFGFKKEVQVISDLDSGGTDEGRGMAEIVHDVAPASKLAFYSAFNGEADFAQGIQTLADNGCKVITDDIFYYDEPYFQDGIIAQSVDAVKKKGVTYFSAAGNQGLGSYESVYRPSAEEPFGPDFGTAHNFSAPGTAPRYFQPVYIPSGGYAIVGFQWDQSSFAASGVGPESDYDIYLTDIYGNIVAASFESNILSGEPFEIFGYQNNTENYTFFITIVKYEGPDAAHLKYIAYNSFQFYLTANPIPGILAPTLVGHAKAAGAIATGAAFYGDTPAYGLDTAVTEYFSSQGGVPNYLDVNGNQIAPVVLKKPEIVAPDGGNTSFFDPFGNGDINFDADSYPNFFGTSAAAPHAAGVAALMLDAEKLNNLTSDQIKGILSATASDMDDPETPGFDKGFDFNSGYGLINADKAVGKVKFPSLYIKNLNLEPICSNDPGTERNWKVSNPNPFPVEVKWYIQGTQQKGTITAPPGDATFSSKTVSSHNCAAPNIAIISWKDNFGFPHFDLEFSSRAKCGKDAISSGNSDRAIANATTQGSKVSADLESANVAEVYPNPSTSSFKLYLLLASQQATSIDLFSVDGRKLQSRTVYQSKGVIDIDASAYKAGVYLLTVKQGNFTKTIKLVKQ